MDRLRLHALDIPTPLDPPLRPPHFSIGLYIKIGAKVVRHAWLVIFQMAAVAVPRELFRAILEGIQRLRLPTPLPG